MAKDKNAPKAEAKKKPTKSLKEKRADKRQAKDVRPAIPRE